MKKTILFLAFCFFAAAWWQSATIKDLVFKDFDFSWLSFKSKDFGAKRFAYMSHPDNSLKIVIISPDENAPEFSRTFFSELVKGAEIALNEVERNRKGGRKFELIVENDLPKNADTSEKVYYYGTDPAVFAVILPYAPKYPQQKAKVIAEYMGLFIFHPTPTFTKNEVNSYLSFENTYPVESFSRALAEYAEKRNLQSLLMVTERTDMAESYAHNQDLWFSKKHIKVTSSFFYESEMIIDPMFTELYKKLEIFSTDSIYWGSLLAQDDDAMHVTIDFMTRTRLKPESLMFLPVSYNNDQLLKPYLQAIEKSNIDPIIAFPVIKESRGKENFDKKFHQKYGNYPSHAAYYGYDSLLLMVDAMGKATTFHPMDIATTIRHANYKGVIATYSFSENGTLDGLLPVYLGKIENGTLVKFDLSSVTPIVDRATDIGTGGFFLNGYQKSTRLEGRIKAEALR